MRPAVCLFARFAGHHPAFNYLDAGQWKRLQIASVNLDHPSQFQQVVLT